MRVVSNHIKKFRKQVGMTQQELADYCGVHRDTIIYVENNRFCPSLNLAATIAECFHITIDELFEFGPGLPDTKRATREETARQKKDNENHIIKIIRRLLHGNLLLHD